MIGLEFHKLVSILLILIEIVNASKSEGFCTFAETYYDVPRIETYLETVQVSKEEWLYDTIQRNRTVPNIKTRLKTRCCSGYVLKDNNCIPVCTIKCENARCTGPNKCTCDPGYEEGKFPHRCIRKCEKGYEYNEQTMACDPVCSEPCLNGACSEPELCTCSSGYHKNTDGVCIENECGVSKKCNNGTCTPNGKCLCNDGFYKNHSSSECEPICDSCINGICVTPNRCVCTEGYERNASESTCLPICSNGCVNGNCESPEKCVCNPGYEVFNSSVCNPICQDACLFGTCIEPNKCACFPGYQLHANSNHICNPVCSSDCSNGKCVRPNLCHCNDGFELNEESKECEPVCNEECVNSNCTSPNICTCEIGFYPSNATHCQILCENCTNGYCEEPNVCQCDVGYHIEEEMCVENECSSDLMEDSCENGYCSDGVCECNAGYEKNATRACSPICSLESNTTCIDADASLSHSTKEHSSTRLVSSSNWSHVWIIVGSVAVVSSLCAMIAFLYVRYFKTNSYTIESDLKVMYYDFADDVELIEET